MRFYSFKPFRSAAIARLCCALALASALFTPRPASAELIPAARLTNWEPNVRVGVPGGIPTNRTRTINVVTAHGADNTGATDASPAIQAAINSAVAGDIIYLPAGTYRIGSALSFGASRDNLTLRGAGMDATILDVRGPNKAISIGSASDYNWSYPASGNSITAGLTKGSTTLTIADTSAFSVGQMVKVAADNEYDDARIRAGAVPVVSVSGWRWLRLQFTRVVGKTATTLQIFPPLYHDYGGGALPTRVNVAQMQTDYVGVEDLTIEGVNGSMIYGIEFEQAYACWAKNVKVRRSQNYGFFLYDSLNCEIRKCFADRRASEGTNGAGVLCNSSSACLVEDNIIYKFFPLIEVNQGSSGNVFAYNVFEDSRVYGALGGGLNCNHGPHNSFNLYEGNITPSVQADGYFGSASDDTFYRNWVHGTVYDGSLKGFIIGLNRFTRNYSFVGNILGTTNTTLPSPYSFGNPNMGNSSYSGTAQPTANDFWNDWATIKAAAPGSGPGPGGFQELDLDVQATTVLKGNYQFPARVIPANEGLGADTMGASLFRDSKPAWFNDRPWPPFDSQNPGTPTYERIPAGYRYVHGTEPPPAGGGDQVAPTAPQSPAAVAASATQVNVTWTAATDNVGVTGYRVERSQGAGSTAYTQVGTSTSLTFSDTGLSASTVYNYRVRAVDAAGNLGAYSTVATATTQAAPDTTAPTAPQSPAAVAASATQINVTWTAATDNVGVTGYRVERSQGAGSTSYSQVTTTTSLSFNNTGLTASTVYNYRVRAVDAAGNLGAYSTVATATTQAAPDTTAPTAPQSPAAVATSATQINVTWTAATDNVGVTGYRVERSQGAGSTSYTQVTTTTGLSFGDSGLTASTVYNYRVRAVDAAGNLGAYSTVATATTQAAPDTTAPTAPQSPAAVATSATQINVTWTAATDNVGVTGYRVERSQGAGSTSYTQVTTTTGLSFGDSGLTASTVYNYRVRAVDAAGNLGTYSTVATATTMAPPDTTAPTAPSNLVAAGTAPTQVSLSWTAATDNVGVVRYHIERSQGPSSTTFGEIGTSTTAAYQDAGLAGSTVYNYRVRAVDQAGNFGAYSNVVSHTTGAPVTVGLVASYGFEETLGVAVADGSGNANTGSISGATRVPQGRFGAGLQFDGTDDVVVVNNSATLALTTGMTLEAWVYPTAAQSDWRAILHKHTDAWYLHSSHSDFPYPAGGGVIGGSEKYVANTAALPLNTWSHLAVTYDGETLRLFLNGAQVASRAQTGAIQVTNDPLRIGGNSYANQFFAGRIDEVRIYDRALSAAEIQTDMNTPVKAPKPPGGLRVVAQ